VLRDEGIAELLPACNTLNFDEAHCCPEDGAHVSRTVAAAPDWIARASFELRRRGRFRRDMPTG